MWSLHVRKKHTNNRNKLRITMTWQPTLEDSPTCDSATDLTFLSHGLHGPALLPSARACQTFVEAKPLRGPNHSVLCN